MGFEPIHSFYLVIPQDIKDAPPFWICADISNVTEILHDHADQFDDHHKAGGRLYIVGTSMTTKESLEASVSGVLPERISHMLYMLEGETTPEELYEKITKSRRLSQTTLLKELCVECMITYRRYETLKLSHENQRLTIVNGLQEAEIAHLRDRIAQLEKTEKGRVA